ncbi:hypothetical protein [Anabaena azotica]|uniref:Apea-like HEPN domain-containing protein n=1 Tax=Anabaena azotica FACHB-119 TaxID=947527 RepID=A0ABR8D6U3_9NOST|nr:hypothetical protein [Anabaena azotica]MBD2501458.1 hypothetical protein [Anabaena azotica FACHB-119]
MQARYITGYSKTEKTLIKNIKKYFDALNATYDQKFRVNPSNNYRIAEAYLAIDYELTINIKWEPSPQPKLLNFDIESNQDIDIDKLNDLIAEVAKNYFGKLTLVYSSCGRSRNLASFPLFIDLENVIRELIIKVMIYHYGTEWWDNAGINNDLLRKADRYKRNETNNLLHNYFDLHPIFYLDFTDLQQIIEDEDRKHTTNKPFQNIFDNYDQVDIIGKIGEARELRNRVMHGKYLTKENLNSLQSFCGQLHRFLILRNHVGDFHERKLHGNEFLSN